MNAPIFKRHAALLLRPRSWMPASTTIAPLPNRCIPVAAFSKSTNALGIVPPTPKLNVFMRHLQHTRTPSANFWAVSQAESARNAARRRRFPRSAKPTANDPRRKPHRSPDPWRNRRPFPPEPPRSREDATAGEAAAADEHAGMLIGSICARNQTNACTGCTANHRAKALMKNAG